METSELDFIGTATYGSGTEKKSRVNFRVLADQDNVYRILPPFGLLAKTGRWMSFEASHWGYSTSTGSNRSFRCIKRENRKTGMVEQECPECSRIGEVTEQKNKKMAELLKNGVSKNDATEQLKPMTNWLWSHNLSRSFKVNALREDGTMGRLFLKIRHKQALEVFIDKLMNGQIIKGKSIDPIKPAEGIWINFTKTGKGRDTQFFVEPVYEERDMNGETVKIIKRAPLSTDVLQRMKTEASELSLAGSELSYDQIERLVQSGGDPAIVDQVFGTSTVTKTSTDFTPSDFEETSRDSVDTDAESALLSQLDKGSVSKSSSPRKEVSTEDFRKMFGS